ncbi:MAG: hypothetical protein H6825_02685 [Planctomycetes bacterium]|nr:hypothetical protein [Planctomycetota bacterium]
MTLFYTLAIGGVLWGYALGTRDTRMALGETGPFVYAVVFGWLLLLVTFRVGALARLRRRHPDGVPGEARRAVDLRTWFVAALLTVLVFVVGYNGYRGNLDEFSGNYALLAALLAVPVGALLGGAARLLGPLAGGDVERKESLPRVCEAAPSEAARALLPILVPLVALVVLRLVPGDEFWQRRVSTVGQAGLAWRAMLPVLLPTALVVAWGLDRMLGWPLDMLSTIVLVAAVAWIGLTVGRMPIAPEAFLSSYGLKPGEAPVPLPVDDLLGAVPLLMLASAAATARGLLEAGRGKPPAGWLALLLLFATQVVLSWLAVPRLGPSGAAWTGAVVVTAFLVWRLLRGRRAAPAG